MVAGTAGDGLEENALLKYLATEVRWQDRRFSVPLERIVASENMGYDAVFTAEGHGSDALTPLAFIAGHTTRLKPDHRGRLRTGDNHAGR